MSKMAEKEMQEKVKLVKVLNSHIDAIRETLKILDDTEPAQSSSSVEKVSWVEVIKISEEVSKQATIVGMLWTGDQPDAKALEENMEAYFNVLQGLLLLSHGSTVGAGRTLLSNIRTDVHFIAESSVRLMTNSLTFYGSHDKERKVRIPQLAGVVWEACSALKKTPATNISAIGRAMTRIAVSVKDVLREMNELEPASSDDAPEEASSTVECKSSDDDFSSERDFGHDLSPEEMKIAKLAIEVVSATVVIVTELIRSVSGLVELEIQEDSSDFVSSLEKLLDHCDDISQQVDELGACLYPPQEIQNMKVALDKISCIIDDTQREVKSLNGASEGFTQSCDGLRNTIKRLHLEVDGSITTNLEAKLHDLDITA